MVADENISNSSSPKMSIGKGKSITTIIGLYKRATDPFKNAIRDKNPDPPFNENKLTQVFVEQIDVQIRKLNYPFGVKNQYSDVIYGTKGVPDFYFHQLEEGKITEPILVVESKRLPSPESNRKKEYVIGTTKKNGGIERFKLGTHGCGLKKGGLVGFIEKNAYNHWEDTINGWIKEEAQKNDKWNVSEYLKKTGKKNGYCCLKSTNLRSAAPKILLYHFWISLT